MSAGRQRWNHNLQYHPVILRAIPEGAQRSLDVGWGEDTFGRTRRLARRVLPGVRYRRLLLWRDALVWTKPA